MSQRFLIFILLLLPCQIAHGKVPSQPGLQSQGVVTGDELLKRSDDARERGDHELAIQLAADAGRRFEEAQDMEGAAKAVLQRANLHFNQKQLKEAAGLLENALERFPESSQISRFHLTLANIYMDTEPVRAVEDYTSALQYTDRLPEEEVNKIKIRIHHNLALTYNIIGQREPAFQHFLHSITYARAENDTETLTVAYNNLGMAYGQDEFHQRALYYLEQSLAMATNRGSYLDMYRAYINLGNVYINMEAYDRALDRFNSALEALAEFDPGNPSQVVIHNIGRTLFLMKRYNEAEEYLLRALDIGTELGSAVSMFRSALVLGKMYTEQGRIDKAFEYLQTAGGLADNLHNAYRRLEVKQALHELYAKSGLYEEAYFQLGRYQVLADSLGEAERSMALANAENYLELTRQNDINELLMERQSEQEFRIQNQLILIIAGFLTLVLLIFLLNQVKKTSREKEFILKQVERQKTKLEDLNRSKDKLFAIISHDLRNTLMSMQSILSLIKGSMLSVDEQKELIPLLEASVQENTNAMEDLLVWAHGQTSEVKLHLESIDLLSLLQDVTQSQMYIADRKNIKINLETTDIPPVYADYNAAKLVVRNLISNAVKFSHSGDSITISVSEEPDHVVIKVEDKGIGIPEELQKDIFSPRNRNRKGTRNEMGTGFGLSLSKEYTERMNGRLDFSSKEGHGSTFILEIPRYFIQESESSLLKKK